MISRTIHKHGFLVALILLGVFAGGHYAFSQTGTGTFGIPYFLRAGFISLTTTTDTATNPQALVTNTGAGCAADLCLPLQITNNTDADLLFRITDVGAATKFAQMGPSVNIPLRAASRATSQELLKSVAISWACATGTVLRNYNGTSTSRTAAGQYTVNITAAGFTATPNCVVSVDTGNSTSDANPTSATNVAVLTLAPPTGLATDCGGNAALICVGQ